MKRPVVILLTALLTAGCADGPGGGAALTASRSSEELTVFAYGEHPEMTFTVGTINNELSGSDIETIAQKLQQAAGRVTEAYAKPGEHAVRPGAFDLQA